MSASSLVIGQSNTGCSLDGKYTNSMNKTNNDDLHDEDMLISSNCNFILIRIPSQILSFYSVSDSHIIEKWNIEEDSIWSINNTNFRNAETITISNSGCLTFTDINNLTFPPICTTNSTSSTTSTTTTTTQSQNNAEAHLLSLNGNNTINKFENNLPIIIPSIVCFVGILCIIIFLLWHHCRKRRYDYIDNDSVGGKTHSLESLSDSIEESSSANVNNQGNVSDKDDEYGYFENEEDEDEDDDEIDLSDCRPISHDISFSHDHSDKVVTQRIISIASPIHILSRYKTVSTSTEIYDETTELVEPTMLLKSVSQNSEIDSDLDMSLQIDNTQSGLMKTKLMHKLSIIKDEIDGDDIVIGDQSHKNQSSVIDDSSIDEEDNITD